MKKNYQEKMRQYKVSLPEGVIGNCCNSFLSFPKVVTGNLLFAKEKEYGRSPAETLGNDAPVTAAARRAGDDAGKRLAAYRNGADINKSAVRGAADNNAGRRGFTLIELLVVVLIIGILSAVALPQYEKAVAKSRLMNYYQMASGLRKAQEAYYLANNQYAQDIRDLDVDYSQTCTLRASDPSILDCPHAVWDNIHGSGGGNEPTTNNIAVLFFINGSPEASAVGNDLALTVWFSQSANPGKTTCTGNTEKGRALCDSLNL